MSFLLSFESDLVGCRRMHLLISRRNYLLTYLIGHNNPINGVRPAATHPSRCLCFLRAYASWLHPLMTGLPRFGLLKDARSSSSPTSADPRIKYPSRRSILLHTNDMAEPAQPLNINTLHNVYVVKELIQLTIDSSAEIIANSHWTEDLT